MYLKFWTFIERWQFFFFQKKINDYVYIYGPKRKNNHLVFKKIVSIVQWTFRTVNKLKNFNFNQNKSSSYFVLNKLKTTVLIIIFACTQKNICSSQRNFFLFNHRILLLHVQQIA